MNIDVIFGVLLTLLNKDYVTAQFLANKYEVSTKSIYRYLTILDSAGVPITTKSGKNGGIKILNKTSLTHLYFTVPEKIAMLNLTHQIPNENIRKSLQTKLLNL